MSIQLLIHRIPDDLYAAPLDETYATTIDGVWTHRSPRSLSLIATHLRMNKISIGLFDRETNEMLGWVFTNYRFAISYVIQVHDIFIVFTFFIVFPEIGTCIPFPVSGVGVSPSYW